jgi:hypothetical protein
VAGKEIQILTGERRAAADNWIAKILSGGNHFPFRCDLSDIRAAQNSGR